MRGLEIGKDATPVMGNVRRHMRGLEKRHAPWRVDHQVRRHMRGLEITKRRLDQ